MDEWRPIRSLIRLVIVLGGGMVLALCGAASTLAWRLTRGVASCAARVAVTGMASAAAVACAAVRRRAADVAQHGR